MRARGDGAVGTAWRALGAALQRSEAHETIGVDDTNHPNRQDGRRLSVNDETNQRPLPPAGATPAPLADTAVMDTTAKVSGAAGSGIPIWVWGVGAVVMVLGYWVLSHFN